MQILAIENLLDSFVKDPFGQILSIGVIHTMLSYAGQYDRKDYEVNCVFRTRIESTESIDFIMYLFR